MTGEVGYACGFPGGENAKRPSCKEGLCCGSATKSGGEYSSIVIEECASTNVVTYTYQPPRAKDSIVIPPTE